MNSSYPFLVVLTVLAGFAIALQPGANGTLASALGHPLRAAIVSFMIGLLCLSLFGIAMRIGIPTSSQAGSVPWWGWIGGLLGAVVVTVSLLVGPKLGATQFFAFFLSAQLSLALVLDHFGWLGYRANPANPGRVVGVLFLVTGVVLVSWFSKGVQGKGRENGGDSTVSEEIHRKSQR